MPSSVSSNNFRYEISRPDPGAARLINRKQGVVTAFFGDVEVGHLAYGVDSDRQIASVTRVETLEGHRRRGCATGMAHALRDSYPGWQVVDGGGSNSAEGELLRASLEKDQD